jgi:thiamine-phosphate pyrophosphorylase
LPGNKSEAILRVIDANLNRLREALRVIEEYFRFIDLNKDITIDLKQLRHSLEELENNFDQRALLSSRDTQTDPFAGKNREEELNRRSETDIVKASFKRAQEAARVLEEYIKITQQQQMSEKAKSIRFILYTIEKKVMENLFDE